MTAQRKLCPYFENSIFFFGNWFSKRKWMDLWFVSVMIDFLEKKEIWFFFFFFSSKFGFFLAIKPSCKSNQCLLYFILFYFIFVFNSLVNFQIINFNFIIYFDCIYFNLFVLKFLIEFWYAIITTQMHIIPNQSHLCSLPIDFIFPKIMFLLMIFYFFPNELIEKSHTNWIQKTSPTTPNSPLFLSFGFESCCGFQQKIVRQITKYRPRHITLSMRNITLSLT